MRTVASRRGAALLAVALLAAPAGCQLEPCLRPTSCCSSCETPALRRTECGCGADQTPAPLCPKRSACAVAYYVGDGPAACCGDCATASYYEQPGTTCRGVDRYLHECPVESACFQAYRAAQSGTRYLPFVPAEIAVGGLLTGVWGDGDGTVWVVGSTGRVLRSSAGQWTSVDAGTSEDLWAVWGSGPADVWAAGAQGTIVHYDGQGWAPVPSNVREPLRGLWGSSPHDIWAVGDRGVLSHYDGARWQAAFAPLVVDLTAIWGRAADAIWAVGEQGTILRYDGERWTVQPSLVARRLTGVAGTADAVWVVGLDGTLLAGGSGTWQGLDAPTREHLTAIGAAADGQTLWAVGHRATILHAEGPRWVRVSFFGSEIGGDLLAVWAGKRQVWAAGAGGLVLHHDL